MSKGLDACPSDPDLRAEDEVDIMDAAGGMYAAGSETVSVPPYEALKLHSPEFLDVSNITRIHNSDGKTPQDSIPLESGNR